MKLSPFCDKSGAKVYPLFTKAVKSDAEKLFAIKTFDNVLFLGISR